MQPCHALDCSLIARAREIWQARVERKLTDEDVRQIVENVSGFFSILAEWSRTELLTPANDDDKPVAETSLPEHGQP
jgi:hypothetical protein